MLIGVRKRFVFVANSMTAAPVIERALLDHAEIQRNGTPDRLHVPMSDIVTDYGFLFNRPNMPRQSFLVFGVMRDPADWISAWFRARLAQKGSHGLPKGCDFTRYWRQGDWTLRRPDGKPRLQSDLFSDGQGQPLVDVLIPYPQIEPQLEVLGRILGIDVKVQIPEEEAAPPVIPPDLMPEVRAHYAADYRLWASLPQLNAEGLRKARGRRAAALQRAATGAGINGAGNPGADSAPLQAKGMGPKGLGPNRQGLRAGQAPAGPMAAGAKAGPMGPRQAGGQTPPGQRPGGKPGPGQRPMGPKAMAERDGTAAGPMGTFRRSAMGERPLDKAQSGKGPMAQAGKGLGPRGPNAGGGRLNLQANGQTAHRPPVEPAAPRPAVAPVAAPLAPPAALEPLTLTGPLNPRSAAVPFRHAGPDHAAPMRPDRADNVVAPKFGAPVDAPPSPPPLPEIEPGHDGPPWTFVAPEPVAPAAADKPGVLTLTAPMFRAVPRG